MLTRQIIYDRVKAHLLAQNKRSYDDTGRFQGNGCRYRGPNGTKCAIGGLIPDHLYNPSFEGKSVYGLISLFGTINVFGDNLDTDARFLHDIQGIHDSYDPDEWPDQLNEFAERYELLK